MIMMIIPTKREIEIVDRMREINLSYEELFKQCYDIDNQELIVEKAPQKYKEIAKEYNHLRKELKAISSKIKKFS